jgi:FAD/FMN-containing dehydrogenase
MELDVDSIGTFVALGGTFHSHLDEKERTYRWPDAWVVPDASIVPEGAAIEIPDRVEDVKPASELTADIGDSIHRASDTEAWDAIEGFTVSNDVTAAGDWPGWYDPDRIPVGPEDIVVPISKYPEIIRFAKDAASEAGFESFWFGHAGDGNVHGGILTPADDPEAIERAKDVTDRIFERTVELGGTITGEHGIGRGKRRYMREEHGDAGLAAMRAVKDSFDPNGILNPGKVFPGGTGL